MDMYRNMLRAFGRAFINASKNGLDKTAVVNNIVVIPNNKGVIGVSNGCICKCIVKEIVSIDTDVASVIGNVMKNASFYNRYGTVEKNEIMIDFQYTYNKTNHVVYETGFISNGVKVAILEIEFITQHNEPIPDPYNNPVYFGEDWESLSGDYTHEQIQAWYNEVKR